MDLPAVQCLSDLSSNRMSAVSSNETKPRIEGNKVTRNVTSCHRRTANQWPLGSFNA